MAKITGPLHSVSASGSIGKRLTFRSARGLHFAHKTPRASTSATAAQIAQRAAYAAAVAAWRALSGAQKSAWNVTALPLKISGYNAFVSTYLLAPPTPAGTQWDSGATVWDGGATTWDI